MYIWVISDHVCVLYIRDSCANFLLVVVCWVSITTSILCWSVPYFLFDGHAVRWRPHVSEHYKILWHVWMTTPGGLFQDPSHIPDNTPHPTPTRVWQCHTCIYQRGFVQRKTLHNCYYSLTSQTQPTQQGCFQYHAQGRKGLVSLSRFCVLHRNSRIDNLIGCSHMPLS